MKRIDFHVHTVSTASDHHFVFSIECLMKYVETMEIDSIAITNHNMFDLSQFQEIKNQVPTEVFPGIEIDLEGGHLLLVADGNELHDFNNKCKLVSDAIPTKNDFISTSKLKQIFPDLSKYILIPHYEKSPKIKDETLLQLKSFITAGEVSSQKKFKYCLKNQESLVPVLFGDLRFHEQRSVFPTRQTYIDIGEVTHSAIKNGLRDKNKVFLSKEDGHKFFDALGNGLRLSTGLNIVLGERSTGKSFTLDRINNEFENVKYIKQFSLLERDDEADNKRFNDLLTKKQSIFTRDYLNELQTVIDDMADVDLEQNNQSLEKYISTLIKSAQESEKADSYSKSHLFSESNFNVGDSVNLKAIIDSVTNIIENTEYKEIVSQHVSINSMKNLAIELMKKYAEETSENLKKQYLNDLIGNIKRELQVHTAATPIQDIDLYSIVMDRKKVDKFQAIVNTAKVDKEISKKDIQGYQIVANRKAFKGAQELKTLSGRRLSFSDAFGSYNDPYTYLKSLKKITGLEESEHYKYFINIKYQILNGHGFKVSGGERSEFRMLQEISDAQQFDILLMDEPESSFDNLFLMNKVNELIKDISKNMPVVIVTHNSTVGASIKPDYIIYTRKNMEDNKIKYEIYSGHPSDKSLTGLNGELIHNHGALLNCLEAGQEAYEDRGQGYEILKN